MAKSETDGDKLVNTSIIGEENFFDKNWPVGRRLTISITVREKGGAEQLFRALNSGGLIAGCSIESIDTHNNADKIIELAKRLKHLFSEYNL